jgi:hypothetical protein
MHDAGYRMGNTSGIMDLASGIMDLELLASYF